jgi:Mce-associated membrane protein
MTMTVADDEKTETVADPGAAVETDAVTALDPDADLDADTEAGSDGSAETERRSRAWLPRLLVGAGVVIVVAALAVSGVLGWMLWQQREVAQAGEQAQQAAVAYVQVLTSIDSDKVDENFNQVLDGATGEFKDMYSQSSVQLRQLLIDNKASAHGVVVESAIQSASRDRVVILLFVDQSVSNTNVPDPRIDRSRIKVTMEHVDGRWRASQVALP